MIRSFRCRHTEALFRTGRSRRFGAIERQALRRLRYLDEAGNLRDLAALPGLHLEALKGDRAGQWSIRVNDQWRICFRWKDTDAFEVEIVDYH